METPEIILSLFLAVCIMGMVAQRLRLSAPIAFVLGGLGIGLIPNMPGISIPPDWILLIFLPILLMEAAYFTSLRDFKHNFRPIMQLAIGLVIATTFAVAGVVNWLAPEIGLALGFILGAIISPPDAVAASAVIRTMNVPKRTSSILEGESLVNDATGLVLYGFAVATVVQGAFSPKLALLEFVWMVSSGLVFGVCIAWVYMKFLFPRIQDTAIEILSTLLLPYGIYIMSHALQSSGVIAIVAAGLTVGWLQPEVFTSRFRIPAASVWQMVTFIMNGVVFLLIGLQLPTIWNEMHGYETRELIKLSAAVIGVTIAIRFIWCFAFAYGTKFIPFIPKKQTYPAWQNIFIIAWTGMRGVVSLATALALPLTLSDGSAFPHRNLLIFIAVVVIIFTLIVQGLSLPFLLRKLSLRYNSNLLYEDWNARVIAAREAMAVLQNLKMKDGIHVPALNRIISHYEDRLESLGDGPNTPLVASEIPQAQNHPILQAENHIWDKVLSAERRAILELRKKFQISDDVMHNIIHEMDLLATRFNSAQTIH